MYNLKMILQNQLYIVGFSEKWLKAEHSKAEGAKNKESISHLPKIEIERKKSGFPFKEVNQLKIAK